MTESGATKTQGYSAAGIQAVEVAQLKRRIKSGANWFYWIAGLSVVNTILIRAGASVYFVIGLGITQVFSYSIGAAIAACVIAAAALVGFGVYATKGRNWAFFTGLVVYGLDGLLFIIAGDWFGVIFHGLAVFGLSRGLAANLKYNRVVAEAARQQGMAMTGDIG